jgi:hypothetical protein
VKPGVIGKYIFLSPEGGETKNIISSTPSGLKNHCASFTPGFTGGHNCRDPSDLAEDRIFSIPHKINMIKFLPKD